MRTRKKHIRFNNKMTMFLPILTFVIIVVVFFSAYRPNWNFNWTGIRSEIKDTVKKIDDYGQITSGIVGYHGRTPHQWHSRKWLMKNATDKELLKLTDYPNGAVKTTAFEALIKRKGNNDFDLLIKALNDTSTFFNYQCGCIGEMKMVGEYLVEEAFYLSLNSPPLPNKMREIDLTENEKSKINSLYEEIKTKKWIYFKNNYKW